MVSEIFESGSLLVAVVIRSLITGNKPMSKLVIKDADAAVTAIDIFANLCLSCAEGNYAQMVIDAFGFISAIKNAMS